MTNERVIWEIIDSFFKGVDFFEEPGMGIWIAKHGEKLAMGTLANYTNIGIKPPEMDHRGYIPEFETLTIEPKEGGQYEVAVRIWSENKWRGYKINDFSAGHFLLGINTRGH